MLLSLITSAIVQIALFIFGVLLSVSIPVLLLPPTLKENERFAVAAALAATTCISVGLLADATAIVLGPLPLLLFYLSMLIQDRYVIKQVQLQRKEAARIIKEMEESKS